MKKTVLVIEDNPDNMTIVTWIVEDAGFSVAKAIRADEGIERLQQGGIALVLMDISLPDMSGLDATRIIKADEKLKSTPVIGLSALAMDSDRVNALAAGCDDYQTKPINEDSLLKAINNFI